MPNGEETLGGRLKRLRTEQLGRQFTQQQVAVAISTGGRSLSHSLISSWENDKAVPPPEHLIKYAWLFASPRSLKGSSLRALRPGELTAEEQATNELLQRQLLALRALVSPGAPAEESGELGGRMWHFADGRDVCIVASKLPADRLNGLVYADPNHPNHINLLSYADSDALVEAFGHIRAENPHAQVTFRTWDQVVPDDLSKHVVVLGGDWNRTAQWFSRRVELPMAVEVDPGGDAELDGFYVVKVNGETRQFRPSFIGGRTTSTDLDYDVGLFARGPNPANLRTTLTLCQGVFSRGTLGSVRLFTDAQLRQINEQEVAALSPTFGGHHLEWLMFRVPVAMGFTVTPDLSRSHLRLASGAAMPQPTGGVEQRVTWLEGAN